jgi:hypothetical protein
MCEKIEIYKNIRSYHWIFYIVGASFAFISLFFPTIKSVDPFYYYYFCGLIIEIDNGIIMLDANLYSILTGIVPTMLLIISTIRIVFLAIRLGRGIEVDSMKFIINAAILIGAQVSYFVIITILTAGISYRTILIWESVNPGYGLLGPLIGAIIVFGVYFLSNIKKNKKKL